MTTWGRRSASDRRCSLWSVNRETDMPTNGSADQPEDRLAIATPPAGADHGETEQQAKLAVNQTAAEQPVNQPAALEKAKSLLDAQVRATMGIVVRGIMVSAPGVDPVQLLNSICRVTGNLCAGALSGELAAVLKLRADFKANFDRGVKEAPVLQAPGANAAAGLGPRPPNLRG